MFNFRLTGRQKRRKGFRSGEYSFICDRCGIPYNSTDIHKEWTGLIVCSWCFDKRHPLEETIDIPHEQDFPEVVRPGSSDQ